MVLVTLMTSPTLGDKLIEEAEMPTENPILSDEECLKERKWWCFLLSSIFTFLMGVLSVVVVRGITSICCHKDEDEFSQVLAPRHFAFFFISAIFFLSNRIMACTKKLISSFQRFSREHATHILLQNMFRFFLLFRKCYSGPFF